MKKFLCFFWLLFAFGCGHSQAPRLGTVHLLQFFPGSHLVKNREPLGATAFLSLPLGSIQPQGWLRYQMQLQAKGLSGHLDEIWDDVSLKSAWLGGDGDHWERAPYYVDGLVPLAYQLNDLSLITKAQMYINWVLDHQGESGSLGADAEDWWPMMIFLKALTQYQEATGDARVIPALQRYFNYRAAELDKRPLQSWAAMRWQDELLSLVWLYRRTGDGNLLALMQRIRAQGYDWQAHFKHFEFTQKVNKQGNSVNLRAHGVNNSMGLKAGGVEWLAFKNPGGLASAQQALKDFDEFHGQPQGLPSQDENLAGPDPNQGIETCAVVESMFSLENLLAIDGDASLGDRLEKIAFNALPAALSPDYRARQYDQQANQVLVSDAPRPFSTNGPQANLFGLDTEWGCCTANFHQGWPKFCEHLWMLQPDGLGLAAVAYAPAQVRVRLGDNTDLSVDEETDYPFSQDLHFKLHLNQPAKFALWFRIPAWAQGARLKAAGKIISPKPGSFCRVQRQWRDGEQVDLRLPMRLQAQKAFHNSVVLQRGPLLYSLKIQENWQNLSNQTPYGTWEVRPGSPWNYALKVDWANPSQGVREVEGTMGLNPFTQEGCPLSLRVPARRLESWQVQNACAGTLPVSPVQSKAKLEKVSLIPYGAARLRVTEFPWLR